MTFLHHVFFLSYLSVRSINDRIAQRCDYPRNRYNLSKGNFLENRYAKSNNRRCSVFGKSGFKSTICWLCFWEKCFLNTKSDDLSLFTVSCVEILRPRAIIVGIARLFLSPCLQQFKRSFLVMRSPIRVWQTADGHGSPRKSLTRAQPRLHLIMIFKTTPVMKLNKTTWFKLMINYKTPKYPPHIT